MNINLYYWSWPFFPSCSLTMYLLFFSTTHRNLKYPLVAQNRGNSKSSISVTLGGSRVNTRNLCLKQYWWIRYEIVFLTQTITHWNYWTQVIRLFASLQQLQVCVIIIYFNNVSLSSSEMIKSSVSPDTIITQFHRFETLRSSQTFND